MHWSKVPTFLMAVAVGAAFSVEPAPSTTTQDPALRSTYVEKVEVSLVVLHVTVLNHRGDAVTGLGPKDFRVLEDGAARAITVFGSSSDQPMRVAFLLDVSGSMGLAGKLERAKDAIRNFTSNLLPADQVALLIFADGEVVVKLPFTNDRRELNRTLDSIDAYGKTALRNALAEAPFLLAATAPGRKALIILTDGVDNASSVSTFEAIQMGRRAAVPIYALGMLDMPVDLRPAAKPEHIGRSTFQTLLDFTHGTGGEFFPVFSPTEVRTAVTHLSDRLRGQYIVGYRPGPTSSTPGFHRIQVTTGDPRRKVITREGYVTSGD